MESSSIGRSSSSEDTGAVVEIEIPPRAKKHRFTVNDNMACLRELSAHERPFMYNSKAWEETAKKMSAQLDGVKPIRIVNSLRNK